MAAAVKEALSGIDSILSYRPTGTGSAAGPAAGPTNREAGDQSAGDQSGGDQSGGDKSGGDQPAGQSADD
jgi:hypothetical protein